MSYDWRGEMDIQKAKQHLKDALTDAGGLEDDANYFHYTPGKSSAALDGMFSADDLDAIATIMRQHEAT